MQQNWDDIRVFLAVARHEILSAAARSLRIDPATVGRRVTWLEERAGVVLFARSSVGYVLTGSGDQFLRHALSMEGAMAAGAEHDEVRNLSHPALFGFGQRDPMMGLDHFKNIKRPT